MAKSTGKADGSKSAPAKRGSAKSTSTGKPAARNTGQPRTTTRPRTGTRNTKTRALRPIRDHQSRSQIIAAVAADSGIEPRTVERVARSLSQTLTRHLIRGGSGRVDLPYFGGVIYRGRQAAQKARTLISPLLGNREVSIPAKRAHPTPRFRAGRALKEAVAR